MGRGYNYATCLEGALKLKELVSMHSEGINLIILTKKYTNCILIIIRIYAFLDKIFYTLAILAGELKHGPLGLVDGGTPVLAVVSKDATYQVCLNVMSNVPYHIKVCHPYCIRINIRFLFVQKCASVLQQITSRGGKPILICDDSDVDLRRLVGEDQSISVPKTVDCLQGKYIIQATIGKLLLILRFLNLNKVSRIIFQEF